MNPIDSKAFLEQLFKNLDSTLNTLTFDEGDETEAIIASVISVLGLEVHSLLTHLVKANQRIENLEKEVSDLKDTVKSLRESR